MSMQDAPSLSPLPQDLAACHALIAEQTATLVDLQAARETLSQENAELNLTIQKLLTRLRGHRSERHEDPAQQQLDFGQDESVQDGLADAAVEQQADAGAETEEVLVRRRKKQPKRRNEELPAHLERYEVVAEVPPAEQQCAEHGPRQLIGYDVTETLEFQRPKLRVRVTKYPKYVCPAHCECGVQQPPRPAGLVEGNRYDTSIAAEIVAAKYAYHLPIYRQQDWFAGSGWMPDRSTLLNILASAAYVLEPLYQHYADYVRTAPVIPTDETNVMLLLPPEIPAAGDDPRSQRIHEVLSAARAANKSHVSARMWVYRSLGLAGANVFDFTVSRHRDGPADFLKNFTGTLLGDCYTGFESIVLASESRIVRAACHAHARRYIYEARDYHPRDATQLLAWYRQLYDVEDQARGKSPEEVLAMRQEHSAPIMDQLRQWLDGEAARSVLPKSRLGEAVRYLQNQWEPLTVFLRGGRVPIDNNETEQLMKQIATGRKNWLFIGSVEAGYRAAILLTIVSTAHRYHLDLWLYVKDVLDRLLQGESDLASLRADRWAQSHPEAIRPYRVAEARYKADAKATRRARRRLLERQRSSRK
jgi:transposase